MTPIPIDRPVRVGVSCGTQMQETAFGHGPTVSLNMRYTIAVARAGGLPVVLVPTEADPTWLVAGIDALVLTGGGDLDPSHYGEEPADEVYGVDPERDRFEFALLAAAEARRIPVLGVCRGMQMVNISRGGNLLQHVEDDALHWQTSPSYHAVHDVDVAADSQLAAMVGTEVLPVNSYHHQAVGRIGSGLRVVATADGLPEACESDDGRVIGVQWHPEHMVEHHPRQLALFHGFVELARRHANSPVIHQHVTRKASHV